MFARPSSTSANTPADRSAASPSWTTLRLGLALALVGVAIALRTAHPAFTIGLLCAAILWLAVGLNRAGGAADMLAFGIVVGLGGWQAPATLFCSTFTLAWLLLRRPLDPRRHAFLLLVGVGLVLGASPWYALFTHRPVHPFSHLTDPRPEVLAVGDDYADTASDLTAVDDAD